MVRGRGLWAGCAVYGPGAQSMGRVRGLWAGGPINKKSSSSAPHYPKLTDNKAPSEGRWKMRRTKSIIVMMLISAVFKHNTCFALGCVYSISSAQG